MYNKEQKQNYAEKRYIELIWPLIHFCQSYEAFDYNSILDDFRTRDLQKIKQWEKEGVAL